METSTNLKIDPDPAFETEMRVLFEEIGISNPDLENESLTAFETGYRGYLFGRALRLGADVYFNMNRRWIGFTTDIRFNEFLQIDLDNSKIGYGNTGLSFNIIGVNFSIEGDPLEEVTLFLRGEGRYSWFVDSGDEAANNPKFLGSTGFVLRLPFGLTAQATFAFISERKASVTDPQSILASAIWQHLPSLYYLFASLNYKIHLGRSRVDLGLTLFNPFSGRFKEAAGVTAPNGTNHGGELLAPRAMFTARVLY
jgi:hypothetical protein